MSRIDDSNNFEENDNRNANDIATNNNESEGADEISDLMGDLDNPKNNSLSIYSSESDSSDLEDYITVVNRPSSSASSSVHSYNNRKSAASPPNMHSLRERERRFRLKKLLTKLQLTFLNLDGNEAFSTNLNDMTFAELQIKTSKLIKTRSSKQLILGEVNVFF